MPNLGKESESQRANLYFEKEPSEIYDYAELSKKFLQRILHYKFLMSKVFPYTIFPPTFILTPIFP